MSTPIPDADSARTPRDDERPPRPKHFSLLRSLGIADLFTLGNAACGTGAVFLCLNYLDTGGQTFQLWMAFMLLPLALLFDILDGSIARKRRSSPYGADLDSLADIVSFGVAPATLGFTLGMRGGWDSLILVYFVVCGISRLARYNVTAEALKTDTGKVAYYEGTPIPTSLLLVAALAVAFALGHVHDDLWLGEYRVGPWLFHPLSVIYALSGTAMASATLRIPKP